MVEGLELAGQSKHVDASTDQQIHIKMQIISESGSSSFWLGRSRFRKMTQRSQIISDHLF